MNRMRQGDIWLAELSTEAKRRPVVILTRSPVLPHLTRVTVAPLTSTIRNIPSEVRMTPADGVSEDSVISLDNIQTIAKRQFLTRLVRLSDQKLDQVFAAVRHAFDMP